MYLYCQKHMIEGRKEETRRRSMKHPCIDKIFGLCFHASMQICYFYYYMYHSESSTNCFRSSKRVPLPENKTYQAKSRTGGVKSQGLWLWSKVASCWESDIECRAANQKDHQRIKAGGTNTPFAHFIALVEQEIITTVQCSFGLIVLK